MIFIIGIAILSVTLLSLAIYCIEEPILSFFIILCGIPLVLVFLMPLIQ